MPSFISVRLPAAGPWLAMVRINNAAGYAAGHTAAMVVDDFLPGSATAASVIADGMEIWAKNAQEQISDFINPAILSQFNKKNMRSLTSEESSEAEKIKFELLCGLDPEKDINDTAIAEALNAPSISIKAYKECNIWISEASAEIGRRLTVEEERNLRASFYVYFQENYL